MRSLVAAGHDRGMTGMEILNLAAAAAEFDAVVVLWRTERGVQPVLLPRTIGRPASISPTSTGRRPTSRVLGTRTTVKR